VREKTPWEIRYAIHPHTFVPTVPPENLKDFVHQRIRYASKGSHYKLPVTLALLSVYLLNLLMTIGLILTLFNHQILPIWLAGFLGKTLAEFVFLKTGAKVFNMKFNLITFLLTAVLHPIYIVLVGFLAQFKDFQWKGEGYSARMKKDKYESIEQTEI
jgi:cellulose synthase/poly-beta-1,6-N-acetylglucosamine synthase-like glycosyltransferase